MGAQLKTVDDIMLKGKKIPFVNENLKMKDALKILTKKKLGVLIVQNKKRKTKGIITDGQIRRFNQQKPNLHSIYVKEVMTKNPISIEKDELAAKALSLMNSKKITSLCVYEKKNRARTIGVLHIHNILKTDISNEKKNLIRIFFIFFFILIILYFFFNNSNKQSENLSINDESDDTSYTLNVIRDVSYTSKDIRGNEYLINAKIGEIDASDSNIIFLNEVDASIKLVDGDYVYINSDFGKYNTNNFDTIFSKNVLIKYLDNKITGDYLDFSISRNSMIVSKNVIYSNVDNTLSADVIEMNIETKDTKIFMHEDTKKVNIKNK